MLTILDPEFPASGGTKTGSVAAIGRALARRGCSQIVAPAEARRTESGRCLIDTPWFEGRPLAEVALERSVPMAARFGILRQVVLALRAAHDVGVMHGTLSTASVVVASDLRRTTRVVDFGMSRIVGNYLDLPTAGAPLSPERMLGMEIGPAEDVYLFGCLAFYTLAGTSPFASPTEDERRRRHAIEDPPDLVEASLPRRVKSPMAEVVRRCLAKEPEDRYADATALCTAWCRAQREARIATAWDEPVRRPPTRPPGVPSTIHAAAGDDESIDIDIHIEDSVPIRVDDTDTIIVDVPY